MDPRAGFGACGGFTGIPTGQSAAVTNYNLDAIREEQLDENDQADHEEEQRLEGELAKNLQGAFENIEVDLEEDDEEDEERNQSQARLSQHQTSDNPFMTSTPFISSDVHLHRLQQQRQQQHQYLGEGDETVSEYLQPRDAAEQKNDTAGNIDQLQTLYEARGHEIQRLRDEIERLRDDSGNDTRRIRHELALLKGENEKLNVQVEQTQEMYESTALDNRNLRQEIESLQKSLQKQEKLRENISARAEDSEQMVQTLQQQLIDLQKKDTALRAREQHDAIVRSLKDRHDSDTMSLQHEVDRLTAIVKRQGNESENLKNRMGDNQRQYEEIIAEKTERIEDLDRKLTDTQKRLTQVIAANNSQNRYQDHIDDPVLEICDLKTALANVTHERDEQNKRIHDLLDEIAELRGDEPRKERMIAELQQRERGLAVKCEELSERLRHTLAQTREPQQVQQNVVEIGSSLNRTSSGDEVALLRESVKLKDEQLAGQETKLRDLMVKWEVEIKNINDNHGKDRQELIEVRAKYVNLKRKVRQYQKHSNAKEAHYKAEIQRLRDSFETTLLGYKKKMEDAVNSKEKKWEDNLCEMKRNFDFELQKLAAESRQMMNQEEAADAAGVHFRSLSPPLPLLSSHRSQRSDEENSRPTAYSSLSRGHQQQQHQSRSQELAKVFEEATKGFRDQLKRPPTHHHQQQTASTQEGGKSLSVRN